MKGTDMIKEILDKEETRIELCVELLNRLDTKEEETIVEQERNALLVDIRDSLDTLIVFLSFTERGYGFSTLAIEKNKARCELKPKLYEAMKKSSTPEQKAEVRRYWELANSITL